MLKKCTTCEELKELSEFHRNPMGKYKIASKCKICRNPSGRLYIKKPEILARTSIRNKTKKGRENIAAALIKYQNNNPAKYKARTELNNAVRNEKVIKKYECESCGSKGRIDGHHANYSKPLAVLWLCRVCHKQWHIDNGKGRNG